MSTKREETERLGDERIAMWLKVAKGTETDTDVMYVGVAFLRKALTELESLRSSPAGGGGDEEGDAYKAKSSEGAEQGSEEVALLLREGARLADWLEGRAKWADASPKVISETLIGSGLNYCARVMRDLAALRQPPASEMVQGKEALEMLGEWHRLAEIGTREKWKTGDGRPSITSLWRDLAARQAPFLRAVRAPIGSGSSADEGGSMTKDSGTHTRVDREALQNKGEGK